MTSEAASWTSLPVDLKTEIVEYLYYSDKQALSRCSKSDRALITNSRWIFDRIEYMVNRDSKKSMEVEHRYRMDVFTKDDKGTEVEKRYRGEGELHRPRWETKSEEIVEGRDWQEMASERLNEMLSAQHYKIDDIRFDLFNEVPVLNRPIVANTVRITAEMRPFDASKLFKMIDSFRPTISWFEFRIGYEIPPGLASLEAVKKAKSLVFSGYSGITNKELVGLESEFLDIYTSDITRKGMKDFINKRYDLGIECRFDVNAFGEELIQDGFDCELANEEDVRMFNLPGKWKLTKPGSQYVCYIVDLEQSNVQGGIRKRMD